MGTISIRKLFVVCLLSLTIPATTSAMPLGLFMLETGEGLESSGIYAQGETVYLSTQTGVWIVTDSSQFFTPITHPVLGNPSNVTAPMEGPDGNVYVGATFFSLDFITETATLFDVNNPSVVVNEWLDAAVSSLDSELNGYGALSSATGRLNADGTTTRYATTPVVNAVGALLDVSASGFAVGVSQRFPGDTLLGATIWSDEFSPENLSLLTTSRATSVRDRLDGGVNIGGILDGEAFLKFGNEDLLALTFEGQPLGADEIFVTGSGFAVINTDVGPYGYYNGLTAILGEALPLSDILPELDGVEISRAGRPMSIGGELFLPLDGSLYLFGGPDPTAVPEPSTMAIASLTLISLSFRCRAA